MDFSLFPFLTNIDFKVIRQVLGYTYIIIKKYSYTYRKVASSNTSRLEAHECFFRLLMKEIFGPYETLGSVSVVFADDQSENKI